MAAGTCQGDCHAELHFVDGGPLTLQYLLAVDTINFCFWPSPGLEYEHLARGLKARTGPQCCYQAHDLRAIMEQLIG
jgi:hypothetical protein